MRILKDIACTIIELRVLGAVTHFTKQTWVEEIDPISGDFGYFDYIKEELEEPMVCMQFTAKVDKELDTGGIYVDDIGNKFIAIDNRTIHSYYTEVNKFEIPKNLCLIQLDAPCQLKQYTTTL